MDNIKNFDEIVEMIKSDEEALNKFLKEDDINVIYETFKNYGYSGTMEDIQHEILNKLHDSSILDEDQLNNIAGGKMDFKKGIAGLMSTLTLTGTAMPSIGATNPNMSNPAAISSKDDLGTIQKIKRWGNQGIDKVKEATNSMANKTKELYKKASENKTVKYGGMTFGGLIVLGAGGYLANRLKAVKSSTPEGADLIQAANNLFVYTLQNYSKIYDNNGKLLDFRPQEVDIFAQAFTTKWEAFAGRYFSELNSKFANERKKEDLIPFLIRELPSVVSPDSMEGRDCKILLEAINKFLSSLEKKQQEAKKKEEEAKKKEEEAKKKEEEAKKKEEEAKKKKEAEERQAKIKERKEAADAIYEIGVLKNVIRGIQEIYTDVHQENIWTTDERIESNQKTEQELTGILNTLNNGIYGVQDVSDVITKIRNILNYMSKRSAETGGWFGFGKSAYADHAETISKLLYMMNSVEKNKQ